MLMSDGTIADLLNTEDLTVDPIGPDAIQPCSVDLRLGDEVRLFRDVDEIDPQVQQVLTFIKKINEQGFSLLPGEFVLGTTLERVSCSARYAITFTGKSSLARLGLLVHATAGHIDPGFEGKITLEIMNLRGKMFRLRAGMPIGQLLVFKLDADAIHPYGDPALRSRYMGQSTVTESRSWM